MAVRRGPSTGGTAMTLDEPWMTVAASTARVGLDVAEEEAVLSSSASQSESEAVSTESRSSSATAVGGCWVVEFVVRVE